MSKNLYMMVQIFASLLHLDLANLLQEVRCLEEIGIDGIHVDIMDGIFVPSIAFGPLMIKTIRRHTKLPIHCHLMISRPHKYAIDFVEADADLIIFHVESTSNADQLAREIRSYGKGVGAALNPATHESTLEYLYNIVDQVLVMTTNPGVPIQKFQNEYIRKIDNINTAMQSYHCVEPGVYGDIKAINIADVVQAGAHHVVVGNALLHGTNGLSGTHRQQIMKNNLDEMKAKVAEITDSDCQS